MRKSFLTKAVVAVGVMVSAMALSSVCAWATAGTNSVSFNHGASTYIGGNHYYTSSGVSTTETENPYFTVYLAGDRSEKSTANYLAIGGSKDTISFTTTEPNAEFSITVSGEVGSNKRNITFEVPSGADAINTISLAKSATKDTYNRTLSKAGKYTVKFDGGSAPAVYSVTVTEVKDTTPSVTLNETASVFKDDTVQLTANVSNIDSATYNWEVVGADNHIQITDGANTATATIKGLSAGTQSVKVTVTGTNGGTAISKDATCTVTVSEPIFKTGSYTPSDAVLTCTGGSNFSAENGTYSVTLTSGEKATIKAVSAPTANHDYLNDSITVTETSAPNLNLTALATVETTDKNTFSKKCFNVASDRIYFAKAYSANGYSMTTATNETGASSFSGEYIQLLAGSTITYTPNSDGIITVKASSSNTSAKGRGYTFTSSDASETFTAKSLVGTSAVETSYAVSAGKEYTLTIAGVAGVDNEGKEFEAAAGNINVYSLTFKEGTKVSEAYEATAKTNGTINTDNAGGATVSAKYVYANETGYFVLDFDLTNVEESVTALKYQNKPIDLYKTVKFAEGDTITAADKHALHAFIVTDGTNGTYAVNNATVTAVTAE